MTDAITDAATSRRGHGRRWDRLLANAPRRGDRAFDTCEPPEVPAISAPANVTSIRAVTAVVATVAVLSVAPSAAAYDTPARLNDVARVYSLGVGDVRCPPQAEWDADPHRASFGWGYTNLRRDYSVLPPMICAGALNVGSSSVPAWQQAAGVWMLVHEAFHLRHWRFRRNEAKVGCQTIVYFTDAAARLGASEAQAQLLYPYALALYELEIDLYPWHRDPTCTVPPWIAPSAP